MYYAKRLAHGDEGDGVEQFARRMPRMESFRGRLGGVT